MGTEFRILLEEGQEDDLEIRQPPYGAAKPAHSFRDVLFIAPPPMN